MTPGPTWQLGRMYAKGPIFTPSPMVLSLSWEALMVTPSPTVQSRTMALGPTSQSRPMTVSPRRIVPGSRTVPSPTFTRGPT